MNEAVISVTYFIYQEHPFNTSISQREVFRSVTDDRKQGFMVCVRETDMAVVINIDECVAAMQRCLDENRDGMEGFNAVDFVCMHRVPASLNEISPKAIHPEIVSIGPYHHNQNKDELLISRRYKWWSLQRLLDSLSQRGAGVDLKVLFEAANQLEERARRCYDEFLPNMSNEEFVEMMVLDGCFIIELFRHGGSDEEVRARNDPWLCKPGLISIMTGDLLKLENQLPFFVLERLFSLSSDPANEGDPLQLLALKFFNVSVRRPNEEVITRSTEFTDVKHLLHLFHLSFSTAIEQQKPVATEFQIFMREARRGPVSLITYYANRPLRVVGLGLTGFSFTATTGGSILTDLITGAVSLLQESLFPDTQDLRYRACAESIRCASKLRSAGVVFKPQRADNFLLIVYMKERNRLQIPPITMDDLTITVFINCIALERCKYQHAVSYFTTYIAFMSCLVTSSKDVAILCANGIISSSFSHNDHDVALLFKTFGEKVNFQKKDCYLSRQFRDVEGYYNSPWANFVRTYFSRPWSVISFLSALLILVLTAGQTVVSILTFIQKK